jgi:hypothetical protein
MALLPPMVWTLMRFGRKPPKKQHIERKGVPRGSPFFLLTSHASQSLPGPKKMADSPKTGPLFAF